MSHFPTGNFFGFFDFERHLDNMRLRSTGKYFLLLFIIILTILLRVPGVFWGISHGDIFEPDELQHVAIAKDTILRFDRNAAEHTADTDEWNARAFGIQIGYLSLLCHKCGVTLSQNNIIIIGRCLSLFYSVLLVLLVYFLVRFISMKSGSALIAAAFLAVSDLNVTYSHYAVPEICHVFYFYLAIFFMSLYIARGFTPLTIVGLGFSLGMCLATKFDPSPLCAFGIVWLLYSQRPYNYAKIVLLAALIFLSFAFSWNSFDVSLYYKSFRWVAAVNQNTVLKDHHFIYNPLLYASALIAGSSFFIFAAGSIGFFKTLWKANRFVTEQKMLVPMTLSVALLFFIYWSGDATFVRRASAFVPFFCIFSCLYISQLNRKSFLVTTAFLIFAYTMLLSIFSQSAFINDTRYDAKNFIDRNYRGDTIVAYSPYSDALVKNFKQSLSMYNERFKPSFQAGAFDLIILHEAYYGRYGKYFTTPFRIPENCDEVYHCRPELIGAIQDIIYDKSVYTLKRQFPVEHPFAERILFKKLYGTYETFLGDVLIYERSKNL